MAVVATAAKAVMPKGKACERNKVEKVAAVPKPNFEEYRKRDHALRSEMQDIQTALSQIQDKIRQHTHGRHELEQRKGEIRNRLDEIRAAISQLEEQRDAINAKLFAETEQSRQKRSQAQQMKKDLQFGTVQEIDQKIEELEESLISNSVPLKQEKSVVAQITQLKRMKPVLMGCTTVEKQTQDSESAKLTPLSTQLENIKKDIQKHHERRIKEQERYRQMLEGRARTMEPVKDFIAKRGELQNKLAELRAAFDKNQEEQLKADAEHRAYLGKLQQAKMDQNKELQRKQDMQMKREKLQNELEFLEEVTTSPDHQLIQQTVNYLQRLVLDLEGPQTNAGSTMSPSSAPPAASKVDEDFEAVILPKKLREDTDYQPKKKGGKKKVAKLKKGGIIAHDYKIFADFQQLGVSPPLNYSDAPAVLELLAAKLKAEEEAHAKKDGTRKARIEAVRAELEALDKQEKLPCPESPQSASPRPS